MCKHSYKVNSISSWMMTIDTSNGKDNECVRIISLSCPKCGKHKEYKESNHYPLHLKSKELEEKIKQFERSRR